MANNKKVIIGVTITAFLFLVLLLVLVLSKSKHIIPGMPGGINKPTAIQSNSQTGNGSNLSLGKTIKTESNTTKLKTLPKTKGAKKQVVQSLEIFVNKQANLSTTQTNNKVSLPSASVICDGNKCTTTGSDKQLIPLTVYALYNYYVYSGDKNVLPKINNLLAQADEIVDKGYNNWPFQPVYLHCSVLYDIHKGIAKDFPDKKDVPERVCRNGAGNYYIDGALEKSTLSNLSSFPSQSIIYKLDTKNVSSLIINKLIPKTPQTFDYYAIAAADYPYHYLWYQYKNGLQFGRKYLDLSLDYLVTHKNDYTNNLGLLGVSALNLYQATKNNEYLKFAQYASSKNFDNTNKLGVRDLVYSLYLNDKLYEQTNRELYKNRNISIFNKIYSDYYDKEFKAILSNKNQRWFDTDINALYLGLLSKYINIYNK